MSSWQVLQASGPAYSDDLADCDVVSLDWALFAVDAELSWESLALAVGEMQQSAAIRRQTNLEDIAHPTDPPLNTLSETESRLQWLRMVFTFPVLVNEAPHKKL